MNILISIDTDQVKSPILVAIEPQDLEQLGAWPIERRWYAIAIENLLDAGARNIYLDLAFPLSDIYSPESDDYLFNLLRTHENIFIQNHTFESSDDSISVFGLKKIHSRKTFVPFSDTDFSFRSNRLIITSVPQYSLVDLILEHDYNKLPIITEPIISPPIPDYSITEIIKGLEYPINRDVIIYLDYPGATSYISNSDELTLSTSLVQWWVIDQIQSNAYQDMHDYWRLFTYFLVTLLPFLGYSFYKNYSLYISLFSFLLVGLVYFVLFSQNIFVPNSLLVFLIPGTLVLTREYYLKRNTSVAIQPQPIIINTSSEEKKELENLRYKLNFYDNLKDHDDPINQKELYATHKIICHASSPLIPLLRKANEVAKTNIPVIILGDSGTGKEQLAKYMHDNSDRSNASFIAINCGSLNENLIESELFGYEKGAFTGASVSKKGKFELANGGSLFLDEIAETSLAFQVKLLRVIQEGVFERVGGNDNIKVSARIMVATHKNLSDSIKQKLFREDLYYRLNGFTFTLPPLKKRVMDIAPLFKSFLFDLNSELKFSDSLIDWLNKQEWNGNIRQLKYATERAVINAKLSKRHFLIPQDFELDEAAQGLTLDSKANEILAQLRSLGFSHRSISKASEILGVHRATVTEYFRGWIIHFYSKSSSINDILYMMSDGHEIDNSTAFEKRVHTYYTSITEKVEKGLKLGLTNSEIKDLSFPNLPHFFLNDLHTLIDLVKKDKGWS